jgi:hypothetical protein
MVKDIDVKIVLTKNPENMVAAVADVEFILGQQQGFVKVCGLRIMVPRGNPAWVSMPARQGKSAWFDTVSFRGPIKKLVECAVLAEYERVKKSTG